MHELMMMKGIIRAVKKEMAKNKLKTLKSLKIKVCELDAAQTQALRLAFDESLKEARLPPSRLDIIKTPVTARCSGCGKKLRVSGFHHTCPSCGSTGVEELSCPQIEIVSMEAEP